MAAASCRPVFCGRSRSLWKRGRKAGDRPGRVGTGDQPLLSQTPPVPRQRVGGTYGPPGTRGSGCIRGAEGSGRSVPADRSLRAREPPGQDGTSVPDPVLTSTTPGPCFPTTTPHLGSAGADAEVPAALVPEALAQVGRRALHGNGDLRVQGASGPGGTGRRRCHRPPASARPYRGPAGGGRLGGSGPGHAGERGLRRHHNRRFLPGSG